MDAKKPLIKLPAFPVWARAKGNTKDHLFRRTWERGLSGVSLCGTVDEPILWLTQPEGDRCKNCERIAARKEKEGE